MKSYKFEYSSVPWIFIFLLILSSGSTSIENNYTDNDPVIEFKVDSILALMTLEEKIGQMSQVRHFSDIEDSDIATRYIGSVIHTDGPQPGEGAEGWQARFRELQEIALSTRLGIPLIFGVDAVHGQNTFNGATIFPHNIGMGATRNALLVEEAAKVTSKEMKATGFNWTFSPCIAIPLNEKWGRFYEAYSESPELTQELVRASVKGHQGIDSDKFRVMATAKHYLGDGATDHGIEGGVCTMSRADISKILLPPYESAVKEGVGAIMVSFNEMMGKTMHANKEFITDTLKNGLNFDGIVVSDWKAYSRFGSNEIINAGVDMVMAVDGDLAVFQDGLKQGVLDNVVSMERIDDAVRRILRQKYRLGVFDDPFPDPSATQQLGSEKHRAIARQAVRESLVMLKNENNILPIDKKTPNIVVVGEHANNSGLQSGGWTIGWQGITENYEGATTILDGIREIAEGEVIYDTNGTGGYYDADLVIAVVGETPYAEFMGDIKEGNKYTLKLNAEHQGYINSYHNKGPGLIVLLVSGRPLVVTDQIQQSDAFIAAWLPGSEGDGIAEVIFGEHNFSGKLPHSWPRSEEDFMGKFGPNYWDHSTAPLFEYGHGLNY